MTTMPSRAPTTASVSRKARSAVGSRLPKTVQTATAKAMAVATGAAQPPIEHLALELEGDDEEEGREQPVGRPRRDGQVQVQGTGADDGLAQRGVAVPEGGVRPDQSDDGTDEEQDRAGVLGTQVVGEVAAATGRQAAEQAGRSVGHGVPR